MRRFLLICCIGVAGLALPTGALAGKPASFKAGAYNGKANSESVTVTLKRGSCKAAAGDPKSSLKLCVSLTKAPEFQCHTPTNAAISVTAFATPVQLPASGKITQKTTVTQEGFPGAAPNTGEATFGVVFKKNGTAKVTLSLLLNESFGAQTVPCTGSVTYAVKVH